MGYEYKQFYRRKLPHIHTPGATLFVTFRLADSIPKIVLRKWLAEKTLLFQEPVTEEAEVEFRRRWFVQFEEILDKAENGPVWLGNPQIAQIIADSLHHRDGREYTLHAYTIMCNHVHILFTPLLNEKSLIEIPHSKPIR